MIIPNWNGKQFLEDCLSSLRRQTFRDFETILVDNGSTDGSAEFVREQFPEVKLLALPENLGFTGGNSTGYERAQGNLVVLLNNDTEAHPKWLEEIRRASGTYPKVGSFASKMMYFDDRGRIENCGFDLGVAGTTLDLGRDELDGPDWTEPRRVFGACGGAAAYRRNMLDDIGFLDPQFFLIYEDVDLSFRAQLRGYECIYIPRAIVYHRYRASIGKASPRQVFFSQRNIELVYLKNMPLGLIFQSVPERLIYELGSALYFSRQGAASAFWRAKLDVLKCLPRIWRERKEIQKGKKVATSQLKAIMRKSLLLDKWKKFAAGRSESTREQLHSRPRSPESISE
ncbi:MAG: glycosyltransferase family 2 protein [Terracidiphilus sp.]